MSANAVDAIGQSGTGLVTITGGVPTTADVFDVKDSAAGRSGGGQLVQVFDKNGNPIWSIPSAGGPRTYGDNVSAGVGVFGPFSGWDGPDQAAAWDLLGTNHATWRFFAGTGAPAGNLLGSNINDWYYRIDTQTLLIKTAAAAWTAAAAPLGSGGVTASAVIAANGGTSSAGSAPVIAAPGFANGVASQLSDLTRDYMVYMTITTAGTVFTLSIGPTSGVADAIVPSSTVSLGESFSVRLPAGWFLKWTATLATISQIAVGC